MKIVGTLRSQSRAPKAVMPTTVLVFFVTSGPPESPLHPPA